MVNKSSSEAQSSVRAAALRALTVRPLSVSELHRRLAGRFDASTITPVLDDLKYQGLLDDVAFAAEWRESRERFSPRSASLVMQELLLRGVDRHVASAAVSGMDDQDAANRATIGYRRRLIHVDRRKAVRRLWAYLQRRRFSEEVTQRAMGLLTGEPDSSVCVSESSFE